LISEALQPDAPFAFDRCGACTRCLDACPTQCILPDRTLDARRCISYLTIENRGPIPPDLRTPIGEWLFGCDICQQVCPWNLRFAGPTTDEDCQPVPLLSNPDPVAFLEEAPPIRRTAVARAGDTGMARNATVVLGNRKHTEDVSLLKGALLSHRSPLVRAHAAWALGEIGGDQAEAALKLAAEGESDSSVSEEITAAGSRIGDGQRRPWLGD
jgi:epoxyqueuosine reductase